MDYPEHEKLTAMKTEIDAVASFMDKMWEGEITYSGLKLRFAVEYEEDTDLDEKRFVPVIVHPDPTDTLAQWSGIDQKKLEAEKRQMLKVQRELNERHT
jgi:hypothetical protein